MKPKYIISVCFCVTAVLTMFACGQNKNNGFPVPISCTEHNQGTAVNTVLIGDSITYMAPDDILPVSYVNCGMGGAATTDVIRDFESVISPVIKQYPITDAWVAIGINDVTIAEQNGDDWTKYSVHLASIILKLKDLGLVVHLRGLLPTNGTYAYLNEGSLDFNKVNAMVAKLLNVEFINSRQWFEDGVGYLTWNYTEGVMGEGIHLNAEGYDVYRAHFTD